MSTRRRSPAAVDPRAELRRRLLTLGDHGGVRRIPFHDWALRVPEPKRGTLDFKRFPFQRELYEATSEERELVVKKGTQLGISAWAIRSAMYWADQEGLTALYVFPYQQQLGDFSTTRIGAAIAASQYLRERTASGTQQRFLKQIGPGHLVLRGSESAADLQAVDADVLVLDEYDLLDQRNVPDAERRLGASEVGLIRRVGVPSIPGFGISELYAESDRRRWHVRCERCSDWQPLSFEENVDCDRLIRVCRRCRSPLEVGQGEWVAEFPDRDVRGYHVPRLIMPGVDLRALVRSSRETAPERRRAFFNKELGEEYAPEDARLTAEHVRAAQRDYICPGEPNPDGLVTMGVDVASVRSLHVRISAHRGPDEKLALFIGEVDGFAGVDDLMDRYGVWMCAIDAQPERRLARAFAERYPGRIYLVTYRHSATDRLVVVDEEDRRLTVSRVDAIDATLDLIRRQRNLLPRHLPPGYVTQLQAAVRSVERDESGRVRVRYRSTCPDDYLHAEVFDLVAGWAFDYRAEVRRLLAPAAVLVPFEAVLPDFERSDLGDYDAEPRYHPGPADPVDFNDPYAQW